MLWNDAVVLLLMCQGGSCQKTRGAEGVGRALRSCHCVAIHLRPWLVDVAPFIALMRFPCALAVVFDLLAVRAAGRQLLVFCLRAHRQRQNIQHVRLR